MKTYMVHCTNSVFKKYQKVIVHRPLKYAPYAQAGFLVYDNCLYLVSYSSCVFMARKDYAGSWYIEPREVVPSYSRTTLRHTTLALREMGMNEKEIIDCEKELNGGFCYVGKF